MPEKKVAKSLVEVLSELDRRFGVITPNQTEIERDYLRLIKGVAVSQQLLENRVRDLERALDGKIPLPKR